MKVLIIGGGAAGMMAALTAAEDPQNHVTLLERQARVGRKLLATGNGRCNLTNRNLSPEHYHGADRSFILPALQAFGVGDTLAFFRTLGLLTVTEPSGRVYPLSDQANSVADVLRFALDARGVETVCSADVLEVGKKACGWRVTATSGAWFADKLIVTAGGCAGKKLGGTHSGYRLLGMLGHTCTELLPSLTQIKTDPAWVRALKGVRADAKVVYQKDGRALAQSAGEAQFAEFGLSGPVAFELSRAASVFPGGTLLLDLLRDYSRDDVLALLQARRAAFPNLPAEELLSGALQSRLGKTIVRRCGLPATKPLKDLTQEELAAAAAMVKCYALETEGVMGMDAAQVTAGGAVTSEFDPETLESRLAPGVFAAGEVLDVDGDCGGYNLQWAWSSGRLAGRLGKIKKEAGV
jgi:predicted Rossmann fold flavoprotein